MTGSAHCCLGPFWAARLDRKDLTGYQASARGGVVRLRVGQERVILLGQAGTGLVKGSIARGIGLGNAGQVNYAASKAGLLGLTKSVAREFAPRGVRCNAVAPGFIQTAMTEKLTIAPVIQSAAVAVLFMVYRLAL